MPPENSQPTTHNRQQGFWNELLKLVLLAILVVVPFRLYIAQPFIVDGPSMFPTFDNGHYLIIDEISYRLREPARGEVIVFKYPRDPDKYFIKRIIGLPGETVMINNGQVTIINEENTEGFALAESYVKHPKNDSFRVVLSESEYFVMGDNRASSSDSRVWGPLPRGNIVGRPVIRFLPPALMPGDYSFAQSDA